MEFIAAFSTCALICLITQVVVECIPKVYGPTLFILVQIVGALLVPLGSVSLLAATGQAGYTITVFAAGASICQNVIGILSGESPFALIQILGVFLVVAVMGILAGWAYSSRMKRGGSKHETEIV